MYWRISTSAPTADPNIIPRIRITMMSLIRRLTAMIDNRMSADPIHAAPAVPTLASNECPAMPSSGAPNRNNATPRLAPELIPSTKGPASGLRNNVCINRPLAASENPASTATTAFINRIFRMMSRAMGSHGPPVSKAHTSRPPTPTDPDARSKAKSTTTTIARRPKRIPRRISRANFTFYENYSDKSSKYFRK